MNERPIDLLNATISVLESCRTKLHGWAFGGDPPHAVAPDPGARRIYLEAWMTFDSAVKHLKKHRRDEMTFEDLDRLTLIGCSPIRKLGMTLAKERR